MVQQQQQEYGPNADDLDGDGGDLDGGGDLGESGGLGGWSGMQVHPVRDRLAAGCLDNAHPHIPPAQIIFFVYTRTALLVT